MNNENNKSVAENNSFNLVDYVIILFKNKLIIIYGTIFAFVISAIVYFFILDLIYFSSASIKASTKGSGLLSGLEGLPDIGGLDELGSSKSTKELSLYKEILMSRRSLESLIMKFNLMQRDQYDFMEDAVKNFQKEKLLIDIDKLSGIMVVGIYDKDPELAKQMVEFLIQELDKINIEVNVQNAKNNREFIENRYIKAKEDLSATEDTLKSFQQIYGIAPDLQIKASIQSVYALETELKTEEVKLDVLHSILNSDQPEIKLQIAKVNSLKTKIEQIRNNTDINEVLSLGNSPQIALNYLRFQRNVEIQSKILTFLLPLYEQSKIEEKRDTPTILVIDKPYLAEKKTKPKRLTMVIIFTLAGFTLFSTISILKDTLLRKFLYEFEYKTKG